MLTQHSVDSPNKLKLNIYFCLGCLTNLTFSCVRQNVKLRLMKVMHYNNPSICLTELLGHSSSVHSSCGRGVDIKTMESMRTDLYRFWEKSTSASPVPCRHWTVAYEHKTQQWWFSLSNLGQFFMQVAHIY